MKHAGHKAYKKVDQRNRPVIPVYACCLAEKGLESVCPSL